MVWSMKYVIHLLLVQGWVMRRLAFINSSLVAWPCKLCYRVKYLLLSLSSQFTLICWDICRRPCLPLSQNRLQNCLTVWLVRISSVDSRDLRSVAAWNEGINLLVQVKRRPLDLLCLNRVRRGLSLICYSANLSSRVISTLRSLRLPLCLVCWQDLLEIYDSCVASLRLTLSCIWIVFGIHRSFSFAHVVDVAQDVGTVRSFFTSFNCISILSLHLWFLMSLVCTWSWNCGVHLAQQILGFWLSISYLLRCCSCLT